MYGRGSYAPPYGQGQGPQRPMPPYQQQPPGPHFQQGRPLMPGMPPPPPSGYTNPPPPPPNLGQQSRPYHHPSQLIRGGHPPPLPYMQHTNHAPPPPPSSMYGAPVHQLSAQQGGHHMPLPPHLPPPPPLPSAGLQPPPLPTSSPSKPPPPPSFTSPSSPGILSSGVVKSDFGPASDSAPISESIANGSAQSFDKNDAPISDDNLALKQNIVMDLPPPPPKPTDEKVVRNIEVLCQFIAKNGPGFEEMARQKESGNPEFIFLFGGEPGSNASCAYEYYLWMKKKCGLASCMHETPKQTSTSPGHIDSNPSVPPYSTSIVAAYHSPSDSDVDMEDDITQTEKELDVNFAEDIKPESVHAGDMLEVQRQDNELLASKDGPSQSIEAPLSGADVGAEKSSGQPPRTDSPFTLIQNYVSDDNSEDIGDLRPDQEVVKSRPPPHESGDILHQNLVSKSHMASEEDSNASASADPVLLPKDVINTQALQPGVLVLNQASHVNIDDRLPEAEVVSSNATIPGKYPSERIYTDTVSTCKESETQEKNVNSSAAKVDEFGRTVKGDASESEDDDTHRYRKRGRRDRSRSRSRSPSDRRRRSPRRSPRRRKGRRSRSRSWSPKRRRSRSKSPYRPGGDVGDDRSRRDRGQSRDCFDFLKGRCYRGASCRYLHPESNKSSNSRRNKTKQYDFDTTASSRVSDFRGGSFTASVAKDNYEVKCDKSLHLDQHDGDDLTSERHDNIIQEIHENDAGKPSVLVQDAEASVADVQKCQLGTQIQGEPHVANTHISTGEEKNKLVIDLSGAEGSAKACQQLATSSQILPVSGTSQTKISNEPTGLAGSAPDSSQQTHELASTLDASQKTNTLQASSGQTNDHLMGPSDTNPPQHAAAAGVPQYQAPYSNQQSHYPIPPNPSWGILPPPPARPPYTIDPSVPPVSLQFLQSNPSSRNDFSSQSSLRGQHLELPTHSQSVGSQHHNVLLHTGNQPNLPSQSIAPPSSFAPGILPTPPIQYPGSAIHTSVRPFPSENIPQSDSSGQSFQNHPFPQLRPSQYGTQQQIAPVIQSCHSGGTLPMPGYSSDPLNRDHPSRFSDNAGSRIPAHYNPFASTFDQPLSSRFSSTAFMQQGESAGDSKYDSSLSFHHVTAQGQSSSAHVSGQMVASSNSRAGGENLQKSGGDQYDPLFDSIEPSSESFKKHTRKTDHAADYSDVMTRQSTHSKVSDLEEKNRHEPGAVAAVTSLENDEFGETADAEVGAVENGSLSDSDDDAVAEGEFEIDQVKPDGKGKKKKDSRSMRLFKVAVANFVKDVLKPQWRQGNMSKEVFKTIVKKTVDKVSGAMKNHRVPKSQAKIDHYIDSSRRKLTQLVEGYVSKYKS